MALAAFLFLESPDCLPPHSCGQVRWKVLWTWITLDLLLPDDNQMLLTQDLEWIRMAVPMVASEWKLMYDGPSPRPGSAAWMLLISASTGRCV